MSLEQAAFLAQIISAVAVVASLVFVGYQLKHAASAILSSSSQAHTAVYTSLVQTIIANADFARIWLIGMDDPSRLKDEEWVRFVAYATALFRLYESSRVQWLRGSLAHEHWHTVERQAMTFGKTSGLKAAWALRGHWHSPEFRDWFEGLEADSTHALYTRPAAPA